MAMLRQLECESKSRLVKGGFLLLFRMFQRITVSQ
jgi:hypothetical protein